MTAFSPGTFSSLTSSAERGFLVGRMFANPFMTPFPFPMYSAPPTP